MNKSKHICVEHFFCVTSGINWLVFIWFDVYLQRKTLFKLIENADAAGKFHNVVSQWIIQKNHLSSIWISFDQVSVRAFCFNCSIKFKLNWVQNVRVWAKKTHAFLSIEYLKQRDISRMKSRSWFNVSSLIPTLCEGRKFGKLVYLAAKWILIESRSGWLLILVINYSDQLLYSYFRLALYSIQLKQS